MDLGDIKEIAPTDLVILCGERGRKRDLDDTRLLAWATEWLDDVAFAAMARWDEDHP